jgi:hypothetical protein
VCVRSVAERSFAKGGEPCVEGGGQCPTAVKDSSIALRTNAVALGIILRLRRAYVRGSSRHEVQGMGAERMPHVSMHDSSLQRSPQQQYLPKAGRQGTSYPL